MQRFVVVERNIKSDGFRAANQWLLLFRSDNTMPSGLLFSRQRNLASKPSGSH